MTEQQEPFINNTTAIVSLVVGVLGFASAIITLIFTVRNNNRDYRIQAEKHKNEKAKSYNRILGGLLKVYHSYNKHKFLLKEDGMENFPDDKLIKIIDIIDNFENEINEFKKTVSSESEIVPELTMELHELIDILSRFEIISNQIPVDHLNEILNKNRLITKRAHVYGIKKILDEYFTDTIESLSSKADINEEFKEQLKNLNSDETIQKNLELQNELIERMIESLTRQIGRKVTWDEIINE